MAYKLLGIDLQKLAEEQRKYEVVRAYLQSGHRDWSNSGIGHVDGWAQAQNDKPFEIAYRKVEELKIGKRASNLDLTLETVKIKKLAKVGMYTDGGRIATYKDGVGYADWDSDYWAVYTEY